VGDGISDFRFHISHFTLDLDSVYRFSDKLNEQLKGQVEQIAFAHTLKVLTGNISVVFYDVED